MSMVPDWMAEHCREVLERAATLTIDDLVPEGKPLVKGDDDN